MCRETCRVLHTLWGFIYLAVGAIQLGAGLYFLLTLPVLQLGSNIAAGGLNILIGATTIILGCYGFLTRTKSEKLLFLTILSLIANVINLSILEFGEWHLYWTKELEEQHKAAEFQVVINTARLLTTLVTAIGIAVGLIDVQLTFCSTHFCKKVVKRKGALPTEPCQPRKIKRCVRKRKCPPKRCNKKCKVPCKKMRCPALSACDQAWVFEAETGSSPNASPILKIHPAGPLDTESIYHASHIFSSSGKHLDYPSSSSSPVIKDNADVVTVQVEDISVHRGDGDRQINHMKSFSRTPSPAEASQSSSSSSIPPIYECLERLTQPVVYRSRLSLYRNINRGVSVPPGTKGRVQSGDKEHYASLMVELENSFVHKKDTKTNLNSFPTNTTTKSSTLHGTSVCDESLTNTLDSRQRVGDAEFSKELEAALKLIQDLESPNTLGTPSDTCKMVTADNSVTKCSDYKNDSDSTKTLSGTSSLEDHGKNIKSLPVESQSTSGYNSPSLDRSSRLTPTTGVSSNDLTDYQENSLSCVIRHVGDTAVISLYSPSKHPHPYSSAEKVDYVHGEKNFGNDLYKDSEGKRTRSLTELKMKNLDGDENYAKAKMKRWKHFIERKRRPSLMPEVESAIIKSECLAFLSKKELKDRLNQTKNIHREIEAKVHRQRSLRKAESFGSVEDMIDHYGISTCL